MESLSEVYSNSETVTFPESDKGIATAISIVPDDLLKHIFFLLASEDMLQLYAIKLVCKRWKTLILDNPLWIHILKNYFPNQKFVEKDIEACRSEMDKGITVKNHICNGKMQHALLPFTFHSGACSIGTQVYIKGNYVKTDSGAYENIEIWRVNEKDPLIISTSKTRFIANNNLLFITHGNNYVIAYDFNKENPLLNPLWVHKIPTSCSLDLFYMQERIHGYSSFLTNNHTRLYYSWDKKTGSLQSTYILNNHSHNIVGASHNYLYCVGSSDDRNTQNLYQYPLHEPNAKPKVLLEYPSNEQFRFLGIANNRIFTCTASSLAIWDENSNASRQLIDHEERNYYFPNNFNSYPIYHLDQNILFIYCSKPGNKGYKHLLEAWDVVTGKLLQRFRLSVPILSITFSQNHLIIAKTNKELVAVRFIGKPKVSKEELDTCSLTIESLSKCSIAWSF